MRIANRKVNGWEQLTLDRPKVVELVLRVGVVYETDHVQFEVEVKDATSGLLLELASRPHVTQQQAEDEITEWLGDFHRRVMERLGPFGAA